MSKARDVLAIALMSHVFTAAATSAQVVKPERVADAMIAALRSSRPAAVSDSPLTALTMMGKWGADAQRQIDDAEPRIPKAATAVTGDSFSGRDRLSIGMALNTWLVSRIPTPFSAEPLGRYEARVRAIDRETLDAWTAAKAHLEVGQDNRTLLIYAIAFQDMLWNGIEWKKGNPAQAIARLKALPKEAVVKWANAAGVPDGGTFFVAYSLVGIDDLFPGGAFQADLFTSAVAIAEQRIKASPKP